MHQPLLPPCAALDLPAMTRRLDAVIDGAVAAQRVVGAVVLVHAHGQSVYRRAAGLADREAGTPMRPDALFRLASVSKPIVATAALALVSQGRLDLDHPVDRWLPYFRPALPGGEPARITLRHLLTHTAGLSYGFLEADDGPYHRAGVSDGMDRAGITLQENLRRLASVPLCFAPGSAWQYSLSIDVLGAVIEQAAGMPLPDAVRKLVTAPLGLVDTGFAVRDPARLAAAYADDAPCARRMAEPDAIPMLPGLAAIVMDPARAFDAHAFPSAGAGMTGSAADTLRLLEALRLGGAPLLPPALVAEMARNQIGALAVAGWPGWRYGLGFSVLEDPVAAGTFESPGTWRWGGAYGHSWLVDPARAITMVALTNTALEGMSGGGRFPADLCRALYGG